MRKRRKNTSLHSGEAGIWLPWDLRQFRQDLGLTQKQMAKRIGTPRSHYEILESPQLVPGPLPVHITDRLNALQQMAAGHCRKMPEVHCLLRPNYTLRQHRGRWLRQLRGRRWWAYCPSEGERGKLSEIYIVRIDGLVRRAPSFTPKQKKRKHAGGRPPKAESEKRNFLIGYEVENARRGRFERFVEVRRSLPKGTSARGIRARLAVAGFSNEEIEAGLSARTAVTAARNFVAIQRQLEFSTVAKYHREYLRSQSATEAQKSANSQLIT